jgi:SAM-dependent methyltransferase
LMLLSNHDVRRWQATSDERAIAEEAASTPLSPRVVRNILFHSPRIIPDAVRLATSAAYTGMWSSSGLRALLNSQRVLQAVPGVARGAAQWAPEEPFIGTITSRVAPDHFALELGCGSGRISRQVAPRVERLCCGDVSATMLRETRATEFSHIEYLQLDGRTLSGVPDEVFDVVYAHAVFYFFELVPALGMLDEIRRVLRPGGFCIISFRTIDDPVSASEAMEDARLVRRRGLGGGRFRPYTVAQLTSMFDLAGLPVVDSQWSEPCDPSGYVVLTGGANTRTHAG